MNNFIFINNFKQIKGEPQNGDFSINEGSCLLKNNITDNKSTNKAKNLYNSFFEVL
jgi:hypothetical protein